MSKPLDYKILFALCVALAAAGRPACAQYNLVDLGRFPDTPNGWSSYPLGGVNAANQVAGYAQNAAFTDHAYRWDNGVMTDLDSLTGSNGYSYVYDINGFGVLAGVSASSGNREAAVYWDNAGIHPIPYLSGGNTAEGWGINDAGKVVGYSTASGSNGRYHAFLYSGGATTDLGVPSGYAASYARDINNHDQIAGYANNGAVDRAFVYSGGAWTVLDPVAGYAQTQAIRINDAGVVVGSARNTTADRQAVYWDATGPHILGTLGGPKSFPDGINNLGAIVGTSKDAGGNDHAFLWTPSGGMVDLANLLAASGWLLIEANGINDAGKIAGWGRDPNGQYLSFLLVPVDVNSDGFVDDADLGVVLAQQGKCRGDADFDPRADLNADNCVDDADLGVVLAHQGE